MHKRRTSQRWSALFWFLSSRYIRHSHVSRSPVRTKIGPCNVLIWLYKDNTFLCSTQGAFFFEPISMYVPTPMHSWTPDPHDTLFDAVSGLPLYHPKSTGAQLFQRAQKFARLSYWWWTYSTARQSVRLLRSSNVIIECVSENVNTDAITITSGTKR